MGKGKRRIMGISSVRRLSERNGWYVEWEHETKRRENEKNGAKNDVFHKLTDFFF